jgi:hypothetical protein
MRSAGRRPAGRKRSRGGRQCNALSDRAGIAFSGAIMPGPCSPNDQAVLVTGPKAGFLIMIGHAILEIALISLIFWSLTRFCNPPGADRHWDRRRATSYFSF